MAVHQNSGHTAFDGPLNHFRISTKMKNTTVNSVRITDKYLLMVLVEYMTMTTVETIIMIGNTKNKTIAIPRTILS